jgi:hypothetical protein
MLQESAPKMWMWAIIWFPLPNFSRWNSVLDDMVLGVVVLMTGNGLSFVALLKRVSVFMKNSNKIQVSGWNVLTRLS